MLYHFLCNDSSSIGLETLVIPNLSKFEFQTNILFFLSLQIAKNDQSLYYISVYDSHKSWAMTWLFVALFPSSFLSLHADDPICKKFILIKNINIVIVF